MTGRRGAFTPLLFALGACSSSPSQPQPATGSATASSSPQSKPPPPTAAPAVAPPAIKTSWYRASLRFSKGEETPFFLELPVEGDGPCEVRNGDERIRCQVERTGKATKIVLENATSSVIEVTADDAGALSGAWKRSSPQWGELSIPFKAENIGAYDPTRRFPGAEPPAVDVSGLWTFKYSVLGAAIGRFQQTPDGVVTGYIKVKNFGDSQHLAGNVHGRRVLLSTFDGSNEGTVYDLTLSPSEKLAGSYAIADTWREKISAVRDDKATLADKITLRDPKALWKAVPELEPFRGKPTILFLFATWCPSCKDATQFLHDAYVRLHPRGLEVLGLDIELSSDAEVTKGDLERYRAQNSITWDIVPVLGEPDEYKELRPIPLLGGFEAVPVLIFIDARGEVTYIQPGFLGPAGGADHEALKATLLAQMERLLAK